MATVVSYNEGATFSTVVLEEFSRAGCMEHLGLLEIDVTPLDDSDASNVMVDTYDEYTVVAIFTSDGEAVSFIGPRRKFVKD